MSIRINDIVNVKSPFYDSGYWKGKVTEIRNNGRLITVQDRTINFAELNIDSLQFKDGEYWEK